jgi:hypothetical protein
MPNDIDSDDQKEIRRTLEALVRGTKNTLASQMLEKETTEEALKFFEGREDFDHHNETIRMYDNEIAFNQKKLAIAEAKLAELD